ncbi:MAG: carboxypeptidase-like regulatory domain-containing protein [Candidatus Margulisiibacteriota bacterium]
MASLLPKCLVIVSCFLVISLSGCGDVDSELANLTISPSSATIGINQSQLFTVIGKDGFGLIVEVDPTWSLTGGIGDIRSSGLFTAGSTSGEGTVVASYGEKSESASVTVTENGWLEGRVQNSVYGYVPGIRVELIDTSLFDFSDSDGRYSISNIPPGTYEARTRETQIYQVASLEVTIDRGETETWDIFLETLPGVTPVPTTTNPF